MHKTVKCITIYLLLCQQTTWHCIKFTCVCHLRFFGGGLTGENGRSSSPLRPRPKLTSPAGGCSPPDDDRSKIRRAPAAAGRPVTSSSPPTRVTSGERGAACLCSGPPGWSCAAVDAGARGVCSTTACRASLKKHTHNKPTHFASSSQRNPNCWI